jgi:phthiodiolone/phenolphthiodiolone dimycocerosates ketoreductase
MSKLRVGVMDPLVASRPTVTTSTTSNYFTAVMAGADSFWVPDHLNALLPRSLWKPQYCGIAKILPTVDAYLEPWTMLGHLSARNRLRRLHLGVSVTDTGRRNPAVTAQAAATLHLLSRGRAVLGIGTGEREGNEPYGVDWTRPVARFEEAMATIRALWDSKGQLVERDSEFFPLRKAAFDLPPYRGTRPPIWIAAHGPRMLRAVGRFGDGFLPGFGHHPTEYARRLEIVRAAASDAGRDPEAIVPALWVSVVPGRSRDQVDETLESEMVKAFALGVPDEVYRRHGGQHPLGAGFSGAQDLLPQEWDEQTALSHLKGIPASVLREFYLHGTPDEILDQVAEWRDCGVRYFVLANLATVARSLKTALTSSLSFTEVLRKIRKL